MAMLSLQGRFHGSPAQMPVWARSSVMDNLANIPFMPPMGQRWRHHSRRSKKKEHAMAPAPQSCRHEAGYTECKLYLDAC